MSKFEETTHPLLGIPVNKQNYALGHHPLPPGLSEKQVESLKNMKVTHNGIAYHIHPALYRQIDIAIHRWSHWGSEDEALKSLALSVKRESRGDGKFKELAKVITGPLLKQIHMQIHKDLEWVEEAMKTPEADVPAFIQRMKDTEANMEESHPDVTLE